jgi:predicted secreted Zn-dependent protease
MRKGKPTSFALVLFFFFSFLAIATLRVEPAVAESEVNETFNYYDVAGSTVQELRADLNRNGPADKDGKRYDAFTRWYVRWRYGYRTGGQACAIAKVWTTVDITITLPRLSETAAIPAPLGQAFADYTQKLLLHEKGHAQNAIDSAKRIDDGIAALGARSACSDLGKTADSLGYSLIDEANRWDIDYDLRTRHGATQGARFP